MTPLERELRRLIREAKASGRSLHSITDEAGLNYFSIYNWLNGRSPRLDVRIADRAYRTLGGKGFTK